MNNFKVLTIIAIFSFSFFSSCEKESVKEDEDITSTNNSTTGIPEFDSFKEFSETGMAFYRMSEEERREQEEQNGYISMQTAYNDDWEEYQSLASYDEFKTWKREKESIWVFDEEDFFTLPITNLGYVNVVNKQGQVVINGTLYNLNDSSDEFYKRLPQNSMLKSMTERDFAAKNDGKRRIEARISYDPSYFGKPTYLLEIRGYKKYLWNWNVYSTNLTFTPNHTIDKSLFNVIQVLPDDPDYVGYSLQQIAVSTNTYSVTCHKISYYFEQNAVVGNSIGFHVSSGGVPAGVDVSTVKVLFDIGDIIM